MSQDGFPNILARSACVEKSQINLCSSPKVKDEIDILDNKHATSVKDGTTTNYSDGVSFYTKNSIPFTFSTVISSGPECTSTDSSVPLTMALVNKMINPKCEAEDSDLTAALSTTDLHVDDWFKSRSDSMSSLDFDNELKTSDIDVNDFLAIKSSHAQCNEQSSEMKSTMTQVDLDNISEPQSICQLLNCTLPESDSIASSSTNSHSEGIRNKSNNIHKKIENFFQLDKGLFEEMLLSESNKKCKKEPLTMEDKGLFEELLMPGVQELFLTVSSLDKKDLPNINTDNISILESSCTGTPINEPDVIGVKDFDDYDLIGKNVQSLKLLTPQEIESLPTRNLGFDEAPSKTDNESMEEFSFQTCPISNDVDHKLLNILAMDASNDTLESSNFSVNETLESKVAEGSAQEVLDMKLSVKDNFLLKDCHRVVDTEKVVPTFSTSKSCTPDSFLNEKNSKTVNDNFKSKLSTRIVNQPLTSKLEKSIQTKGHEINNLAPRSSPKVQYVLKKDATTSLEKDILPTDGSMTILLKPVNSQTQKAVSEVGNSNLSPNNFRIKFNEDIELPKVASNSNQPGIAKVNIAVNCKNNTTNVSIISSNKEHTVFKINTSDLIRAVSSIKEPYLEPLGLKNQQLMDTAYAAQKLLDILSNINNKNNSEVIQNTCNSKNPPGESIQLKPQHQTDVSSQKMNSAILVKNNHIGSNWPQNFEINQYIQEIKTPLQRARQEVAKASTIGHLLTPTNLGNAIIVTNKKDNSIPSETQELQNTDCRVKHRGKNTLKKVENSEKSRQGENVSISLLPGAPPTMVSVPSILDTLSGPTSSKVNLAQVLGVCDLSSNGEDEESKDGQDESSTASDEKTNAALVQLGVEPDSLLPEIDGDGLKVWSCRIPSCTKSFTKLSYLKVHILSHKGIRPYKCSYEQCDWSFYTSYKLKRHLETHLKRRDYVCTEPKCNRRFTTVYNLKTHELLHKRPKSWACSLSSCDSTFHTRRMLENHMKEHKNLTPPYLCSVEGCTKGYFTPNSLASHMRSHHKEEDLKCQWPNCGKKFDKPCRLKAHMRVHTGQRPYACTFEGCNWSFQCASKLSRHQRKHTNDRKYLCPICKKGFLRSEHLKGHLLTHTGVRNFECKVPNCHAKFTAKSSLYVHLKKHKVQKSPVKFNCPIDICNKKYDFKLGLRHHLRKDHSVLLDSGQMEYMTLIGQKETLNGQLLSLTSSGAGLEDKSHSSVSSFIPFSLQGASVAEVTSTTTDGHSINDKVNTILTTGTSEPILASFLTMTNASSSSSDQDAAPLGLSVPDGLFSSAISLTEADNVTDLGFPELVTKDAAPSVKSSKASSLLTNSSSSARTDVLGNIFLSQRAKKRQQDNNSRKVSANPDFSKVNFCNDLMLSNTVDHLQLATTFPPTEMQDDTPAAALYEDTLINHDLLSDPAADHQSTINLRDLE